ncbi:MAG: hypothetical protein ABR498_03005 [Candidatus Dormibacteria bacterium]
MTDSAPARSPIESLSPTAVFGAVLVIAGSFLPWFVAQSGSISAWQLPIARLVTNNVDGVSVGPFLLIVAIVLLPLVIRRPLPAIVRILVAVLVINTSGMSLVLALRSGPGIAPGFGAVVTAVGGLLIAFGSLQLTASRAGAAG